MAEPFVVKFVEIKSYRLSHNSYGMKKHYYYYTPFLLQKLGYIIFWPIYKFFVRLEIKGQENLEGLSSPIIIASNHTSEIDPTAFGLALPFFSKLFPLFYVSNPAERYKTFGWRGYIYGGRFFNMLGAYSIHTGYKNYGISLEDHLKLLVKGRTVFIFPEGKRSVDGSLNPPRGGIGYMVYITGVSVLPIAIDTFFGMTWKDFLLRRRKVVLTILPQIKAKDLINKQNPKAEDFQAASKVVLDKIGQVLRD